MFKTPTNANFRIKLSSKRQATFPKEFTDRMGFKLGGYINISFNDNKEAILRNDLDLIQNLGGSLQNYIPNHLKELTPEQLEKIAEATKVEYFKSKFLRNER